jgi:hypothetical protein
MAKKDTKQENLSVVGNLNLLTKMADIITKYGIKKIIGSLIVISFIGVMATLYSYRDVIINKIFNNTEEIKGETVSQIQFKTKELKPRIDAILLKLLLETDANRSFIIESVDEVDKVDGLTYKYGNMTYEQVSGTNIPLITDGFQHVNLSKYEFVKYLMVNTMIYGTMDDMMKIDSKMGTKIKENCPDNYMYIIGMCGSSNKDLGLIGIGYVTTKGEYSPKILGRVMDASQRISTLLDITNNIK